MRDIITKVCLAVIIVATFSLGYMTQPIINDNFLNRFTSSKVMEPINLNTESLKMWNELREFWKYNITNLKTDLTLEELKEQGGVCWHYSNWYVEQAKERGLYGKEVRFFGDDNGHSIAIIYDKNLTEYCVMDQVVRPVCFELGGFGDE